jgi:hypothetical protein
VCDTADHVRPMTVTGDGTARIWNTATARFPGATPIAGLFRARTQDPVNI